MSMSMDQEKMDQPANTLNHKGVDPGWPIEHNLFLQI